MTEPLTISIAMATYNGERFLAEQLESFVQQTRRPDELVVCDDGSTDNTVALLEAFAARAPFSVRIYRNPQNLGYAKNFEKAAVLCTGDIIAFSDQDDVWLPEKLARFEQVFQQRPQVGIVHHDALVVDENLNPMDYSLWEAKGITYRKPYRQRYLKIPEITGMTLSFRRNLLDLLYPIPDYWGHDNWIPFAGSFFKDVDSLPEKLCKYRQHPDQVFGVCGPSNISFYNSQKKIDRYKHYEKIINRWTSLLLRLLTDQRLLFEKELICIIKGKIDHYKLRKQMPKKSVLRLPIIASEFITGNYLRYSRSWKAAVKDLLL